MKPGRSSEWLWRSVGKMPVIVAGAALLIFLAVIGVLWPKPQSLSSAYYQVRRGDLTVTVLERGTLNAARETVIRNEVEGVARIISIVPEGSYVKKGDLLVELDSAQARDQLNVQLINYERAKFAVEQSKAQLEILRTTTNSDYLAADLKLKFARIDHDKYDRGQQLVDLVEASNRLVQVEAQLAVNIDTYHHTTNLAAKGYETLQKVDADRLAVLNTGNSRIVASNSIWLLQQFDIPKQRDKFDGDVLQAEQELQRVVSQNERKMAEAMAELNTQVNTLQLNEDKLKRDQKNLDATKIYAPQDGMVVYAVTESHFSSESLIEGGATVRNRQDLIKLPDLSQMKVNVKVHESHINLIQPGLPAYVVVDSSPEQRFRGVVEKVAPLPDAQARFGNPNLKVYNTEVYLIDQIPKIKPGVSAKAEIVITNLSDVLSVPIQAVTTYRGKPVVYVVARGGGKPAPRPVETDMYNTKLIQVTRGLNEGDLVLLSPPFDVREKDLEGGVLAEEEKAREGAAPLARTMSPRAPKESTEPGEAKSENDDRSREDKRPAEPTSHSDKADGNHTGSP